MEVTINYNGQAVAVEVTLEVYEFLDRADHKTENLFHEQRRHWDGREFDEYIAFTEGVGVYESERYCRNGGYHAITGGKIHPCRTAETAPVLCSTEMDGQSMSISKEKRCLT